MERFGLRILSDPSQTIATAMPFQMIAPPAWPYRPKIPHPGEVSGSSGNGVHLGWIRLFQEKTSAAGCRRRACRDGRAAFLGRNDRNPPNTLRGERTNSASLPPGLAATVGLNTVWLKIHGWRSTALREPVKQAGLFSSSDQHIRFAHMNFRFKRTSPTGC